jgi:hypothetical protein
MEDGKLKMEEPSLFAPLRLCAFAFNRVAKEKACQKGYAGA